jgi:hypothetical protein
VLSAPEIALGVEHEPASRVSAAAREAAPPASVFNLHGNAEETGCRAGSSLGAPEEPQIKDKNYEIGFTAHPLD